MHKVYEQGGKGDAAIVHLHYFTSSGDWYITERDTSVAQHQAFGSADLGYGPELGYISIAELIAKFLFAPLIQFRRIFGNPESQGR